MALLRAKKNSEKKPVSEKTSGKEKSINPRIEAKALITLKFPTITEKATFVAEGNVYTFNLSPKANKREVAAAVKELYGVTPLKVNVVNLPAKKVLIRGKRGTKPATRKAYVYLKKGDKIEIV